MIKQTRSAASGSVRMAGRMGLRGLLLTGLCAGLAACAVGGGGSATRPDDAASGAPAALERRAVERWQLLIEGKPEEAYEYLTPGYRSTRDRDAYVQTYRPGVIRWESAEWRGADCAEPDSCQTRLLLTYTVTMPGAGEAFSAREVEERWLRIKGKWYHYPDS